MISTHFTQNKSRHQENRGSNVYNTFFDILVLPCSKPVGVLFTPDLPCFVSVKAQEFRERHGAAEPLEEVTESSELTRAQAFQELG